MNLKSYVTIVVSGSNSKSLMQQWLNWYSELDAYNIIICETQSNFEYMIKKSNIQYLKGDNKTQIINRAIDMAKTKYVLLTNVNVRPEPKLIYHLLSSLILNKKLCAVSPRIDFMKEVYYSGTSLQGNYFSLGKNKVMLNNLYSTDTITKDCVLIRKKDWDLVGKFDPNFSEVYDDIDWSSRAKYIGFLLGVNYNSKAVTLGVKKYSSFRKQMSRHLWINKNSYIQHKVLAIIGSIIKSIILIPIDLITKPKRIYLRYYALYLAYFNFKKIPDIE